VLGFLILKHAHLTTTLFPKVLCKPYNSRISLYKGSIKMEDIQLIQLYLEFRWVLSLLNCRQLHLFFDGSFCFLQPVSSYPPNPGWIQLTISYTSTFSSVDWVLLNSWQSTVPLTLCGKTDSHACYRPLTTLSKLLLETLIIFPTTLRLPCLLCGENINFRRELPHFSVTRSMHILNLYPSFPSFVLPQ
jgi:hypothetical protein